MAGWTPERGLLAALVDAVAHLTAITVAVHSEGGKVPDIPPLPRPVTALARVQDRQVGLVRQYFLAQLLPDRYGPIATPPVDTNNGG